jgi:glucokinase
MSTTILAGDIGGTKSHLGLYQLEGHTPRPIRHHIYATKDFASLSDVCADFMRTGKESVGAACFGVPGPVIDGQAHATNVPWEIREAALADTLGGARVRLINDLGAAAYGVINLPEAEVRVLQRGEFHLHEGDVAVIAAGTGLGEAALVMSGGKFYPVASEGGHSDFAPRSEEQFAMYQFLETRFDHVSIERVLSGPGLANIYSFVREHRSSPEPEWLTAALKSTDPSAVISEAAMSRRDDGCVHALEIFVDIYGAEAGNLALKVLATGGVYLAGGIAPKILPALTDGRFIRAFNKKGRLQELLSRMEVRISLNQGAGLLGAAYCAASIV